MARASKLKRNIETIKEAKGQNLMADNFSTDELYSCLLKWLKNCLEMGGQSNFNPEKVSDGNALSDCLVQLVPGFFTSSWRARIITETNGNYKLNLNNLKKIHRSILEYYDNVLHLSFNNFNMPDLNLVAESKSKGDTSRLIQLVLGIAINCEHKDVYIQDIMGMERGVQHIVMEAIQDIMSSQGPSMVTTEDYKALEEESQQAAQELGKLKAESESLHQQIHDLNNQLLATQDVMSSHNSEMEQLKNTLKETQDSAGITGEAKVHQLQRLLDLTKTEKLKLENERDDYKHKCEEIDVQAHELLERNRNLQLENEEIPILRDSVEEMKYMESKVKNYESVISQYKKKLEDAQELRKQLRSMEDKNILYMQNNLDLEEELRRLGGLKKQLDAQRQKAQELENALAQEKLNCLEATQEAEEKTQLTDNLRVELMQVKGDRDNLSQQVPGTPLSGEFRMFSSRSKPRHLESLGSFDEPDLGLGGGGGGGLMEAFTPEMREKMVKLEKENQILKRRVENAELATPSPGVEAVEEEEGTAKVAEQRLTIERLSKEGLEWKQRTREVEQTVKKYVAEVVTLEEIRKSKDTEIEKYKKYLNKAKKIIENIGETKSQVAEDSLEIQSLRMQLKEKDKQVEQLEKEYRLSRSLWEREEKLVVSAWHEMGLKMHRKFSQERLLTKHKSFLSEQRQSLYKNPVPINTSISLSPSGLGDGTPS